MSTMTFTAYGAEMQKIEDDLQALSPAALNLPLDIESATKYANRLYRRASLSGDLSGLREAEQAINLVTSQVKRPDDLLLLKAHLCSKLHRSGCVRQILDQHPHLRDTGEGMKLEADLLFQEGRYAEARTAYLNAIRKDRSWDNLARFAHYLSKFEGTEHADAVYAEAEDELTSKQMRSFAWIQLQRGLLDLQSGRFQAAANHYSTADRAYPGYWMVEEHKAGLLTQQGDYQLATELYSGLAERVRKPELWQTLGDLYKHLHLPEPAEQYHKRALSAFEQSAALGEVHYYHHLVDYHCTVTDDTAEAIRWAQKDLELRNNFSTQSSLAWALYLNGQHQKAAKWMTTALESGVIDALLFSRAATIFRAVGHATTAAEYHERAHELNPAHGSFHAHHH